MITLSTYHSSQCVPVKLAAVQIHWAAEMEERLVEVTAKPYGQREELRRRLLRFEHTGLFHKTSLPKKPGLFQVVWFILNNSDFTNFTIRIMPKMSYYSIVTHFDASHQLIYIYFISMNKLATFRNYKLIKNNKITILTNYIASKPTS